MIEFLAQILPTFTVTFREIIEVALVLGIVMAATRGLPGRLNIAIAGLAIGICGSVMIAFFTDAISNAVDGMGQEVFNACIMFVAVGFLSWTVIWMKTHGRKLAQNLQEMGRAVVAGKRSSYILIGVIALATFREGAEIVLFTYAMTTSGTISMGAILSGAAAGAICGVGVGLMFYFGLMRAAQKHLFTVTSWMLIFLTAGMAAQGASFLIQADILPALYPQVWDTSHVISGQSFIGQTLGILVGYTPRPSAMELVFYGGVLALIGTLYTVMGQPSRAKTTAGTFAVPAE